MNVIIPTESNALTNAPTSVTSAAQMHIRGLPKILWRDDGKRFYELVGFNEEQRRRFTGSTAFHFMGKAAWALHPEEREHYALYIFSYSKVRQDTLRCYSDTRNLARSRVPRNVCPSLDLAILAVHFGGAQGMKLDRSAVEKTLAHDLQVAQQLSTLIDQTPDCFRCFWHIWQRIHELLLLWPQLSEQQREPVILGVLVLITITESLQPLQLAQRFVPELAEEFPKMELIQDAGPEGMIEDPDEEELTVQREEPRTLQGRWVHALRIFSDRLLALENADPAGDALKAMQQQYDKIKEIGMQADRERLAQQRLSTSQFITRVRQLIEIYGADWLAPALPVARQAWKSVPAEENKLPDHIRQDAIESLDGYLEQHAADDKIYAAINRKLQALEQKPPTDPNELQHWEDEVQRLREKLLRYTNKIDAAKQQAIKHLTRGQPIPDPPAATESPPPKPSQPPASSLIETPNGKTSTASIAEEPESQLDPIPETPPGPQPAVRGTTLETATAAFLEQSQTELERNVREVDLMWAIVGRAQLLAAQCYLEALQRIDSNAQLLPGALFKAAALAPFVYDDNSAAANAYFEALIELDFDHTELIFEQRQTLGQYAVGLAASLQTSMFFPASGAARLLRASNHDLPPELSLLFTDLAGLGEQGIQLTLEDFGAQRHDHTDESRYRAERAQPLIHGIRKQVPLAIEFFRRAAAAAQTLEDDAGGKVAIAALEALQVALSASTPKGWDSTELAAWLKLPSEIIESSGVTDDLAIAKAAATFAAGGLSFEPLVKRAVDGGSLALAQAVLYEMDRTASLDPCQQVLHSIFDERQKFIRDYDRRAETIRSRLVDALRVRLITQDDHDVYCELLDELKRSVRADCINRLQLVADLDGIVNGLEDTRRKQVASLEADLKKLRAELHAASSGDVLRLFQEAERAISRNALPIAEKYLEQLREILEQEDSQVERRTYRILNEKGNEPNPETRSPVTIADQRRIAGYISTTAPKEKRPFVVSLVFGSAAGGIEEMPRALDCIYQAEGGRKVMYRPHIVSAEQAATLRELRHCTRVIRGNADHSHFLHINMPAISDDPGLHEEIVEHVYALRSGSPQGSLRVLLTFDPKATWAWFSGSGMYLEAHCTTIYLQSWARSAIRELLGELRLADLPADIDLVQQETGGWYAYLRPFIQAASRTREAANKTRRGTNSIQELFASDRERLALMNRAEARDALRTFGVYDIPHAINVFADLVSLGFQQELDQELLATVIAEKPDYADLSAEVLMLWSERLGLLSRLRGEGPQRLRLHPTVTALIKKGIHS